MLKKSILFVALAAFLLAGCGTGAAIASYNPAAAGLTVSGHGEVRLQPDVAYITIGVHSEGTDIAQVVAANADQVAAVMQALTNAGVAQADIQTSNFSVYTNTQAYDPNTGLSNLTNYSVDNQVNVTARDLSQLGALLDSAVKAGANNIWGVTFDLADKSDAQAQARDMAVQDAKDEASALATSTGVSLGSIITVSYTPTTNYYGPAYGMGGGGGAEGATTSIVPGLITVSADVSITYALK